VDGVTFTVSPNEFVCLLGPSGCGKTTTLRCIAGLERPDSGTIAIGGQTVFDGASGTYVATESRGLGMVFQSYAIWPHMTIFENVAYPLRRGVRRGQYSSAEITQKVDRILEIVDCADLAKRHPGELSGGQQQRIALARAIVYEPEVLLFDEPLSNLDAKLRERMRFELRLIQERAGFAAVYVTHDQEEALSLSDRIAVMANGRIRQFSTPQEIYDYPVDGFVADFIGAANVIPVVATPGPGEDIAQTSLGPVRFEPLRGAAVQSQDASLQIVIRPELVELMEARDAGTQNVFEGVVVGQGYRGDAYMYTILSSGVTIRVLDRSTARPTAGEKTYFRLPPMSCRLLPSGGFTPARA
jgi:iron(III) transport system ATP-binding protein